MNRLIAHSRYLRSLCAVGLTGVALATPVTATDVTQPSAPHITTEKQTVHMSFTSKKQLWLGGKQQSSISLTSDEYWFPVSGKQLTHGIDLDISHPGALVRLTALSKDNKRAAAINPEELSVYKGPNRQEDAIEGLVTEEQLASTTIFQRSAAFRFNPETGTGRFQLRSSQRLVDDDRYIINVKEKGSQHILHIATTDLTLFAGEQFDFSAQIKKEQKAVPKAEYEAHLLSPSGQVHNLSILESDNGNWQTLLPSQLPSSVPGELHELYLNVVAEKENLRIRRTAKLPFAIASPTAKLENIIPVMSAGTAATVHINVSHEGRYGLRGTIYGTDAEGKLRSIMRSHSAYWLAAGGHSIDLAYDEKLLAESKLQPPYKLKDLVLMDQSKLAVLHKQSQVD